MRAGSLFALSCLISVIVGCQDDSHSSIRETAHKYLDARLAQNFQLAKKYVSRESHETFDELEILALEEAESAAKEPNVGYRLKRIAKSSHTAVDTVIYEVEGYGEGELLLIEQSGQWRVKLEPTSIPDVGLLMQELQLLEKQNLSDFDAETFDDLLLEDDFQEWLDQAQSERSI
ncbi:hypothetical protein [Pontibacter sp. G13]|uniref:hypothetical protein n=1 Tax=Pontibacter sp. G13 TaxID=3074898 RepID=UPI00288B0942|nr:hypothetical protein [Pontibacter sp. G13]WNJ18920.1 hypothetical protein RJD25_00395 [Pontibacter sp. G13]